MNGNKTIQILSISDTLAPRVGLEKEVLGRSGYSVDVFYRSRLFFSTKTFRELAAYYAKVVRKCLGKNIWAVHLTHIAQLPLSPILKLGRKIVVYDAYERYSVDISERHFRGRWRKPVRWLIEVFENWIIRFFADAVLVVSTADEYLHKRYRKYCGRTECLYNVPSLKTVFEGDLAHKFNERILKIAYVGGINYQKGSNMFVPLAETLRDRKLRFEMHVIGPFSSESERQRLLTGIEGSDLSRWLFVHGYLDYLSMMQLLNGCHIGLTLTHRVKRLALVGIGSSRKNYTYMSAGMVVITTDVGQIAYVTRQRNCGVVLKGLDDLDYIASVIESLGNDRSRALAFAQNGIDAIKEEYNWENEQRKVVNIYAALFSRNLGSQRK